MSTIHDVARESGVSITTVSMVLNNGSRPVSAEARRRVLEAARALNYTPNANARSLVSRRVRALGVIVGFNTRSLLLSNPYISAVLQGILDAATELDYNVNIYTRPWRNAEQDASAFRDGRADGVLLVAPIMGTDMVSGLSSLGIPLVVASAASMCEGVPSLDIDNVQGARLAAQHLLSLGHTRIAHLMGNLNQTNVIERRDAFCAALGEAGVNIPPAYLVAGQYNRESGKENAEHLLSLPEPPSAIFAGNDVLALAALEAARERGISVPHELSIIGFDDIPEAAMVTPPLTTIRQPLTEVGDRATRLLVDIIEGRPSAPAAHLLQPTLVVRGTTAPIPNVLSDKRSQ
jgi:DNA-binding LacI/PurR family transcriptional regulator